MERRQKLRVAIECRILDPNQGIGTVILSLARTLSMTECEDQEYTFLVSEDLQEWLRPHVFGPCSLVVRGKPSITGWKDSLRNIALLRSLVRRFRGAHVTVPVSDGYVEENGFDVLHFPTQVAYRSSVLSIYQPWDLQHVHYPAFFKPEDFRMREVLYRAFCNQAAVVCVTSEWTRQDLVQQYGLDPGKIAVIRWGSPFEEVDAPSHAEINAIGVRLKLPRQFFFYPAATWPHKNHTLILQAMHHLANKGRMVELCLTGAKTDVYGLLLQQAKEFGLEQFVHHLGFVSPQELRVMYSLAEAMVFPSKFEGFGLPLMEAFYSGTPVLCSSATVLPETGEDGAAYFDADAPVELADLMERILDEPGFREGLKERGRAVLQHSTMLNTVQGLQHLYREVGSGTAPNRTQP